VLHKFIHKWRREVREQVNKRNTLGRESGASVISARHTYGCVRVRAAKMRRVEHFCSGAVCDLWNLCAAAEMLWISLERRILCVSPEYGVSSCRFFKGTSFFQLGEYGATIMLSSFQDQTQTVHIHKTSFFLHF
jgi:hypothetical protein